MESQLEAEEKENAVTMQKYFPGNIYLTKKWKSDGTLYDNTHYVIMRSMATQHNYRMK